MLLPARTLGHSPPNTRLATCSQSEHPTFLPEWDAPWYTKGGPQSGANRPNTALARVSGAASQILSNRPGWGRQGANSRILADAFQGTNNKRLSARGFGTEHGTENGKRRSVLVGARLRLPRFV